MSYKEIGKTTGWFVGGVVGLWASLLVLAWLVSIPMSCTRTEAAIVRNATSGQGAVDSLNVPVLCLDSLGNPTTCDTAFVYVWKNAAIVFRDSAAVGSLTGMSTLTGLRWPLYFWHRQVSDIDGTGEMGHYSGVVIAKKNLVGSAAWQTPSRFEFDVVNRSLSLTLDSVYQVLSMIRAGLTINGTQSFNNTGQTTNLRADIFGISSDTTAANNLETMLDGTGGQNLSLAHLNIVANDAQAALKVTNTGTGNGIQALTYDTAAAAMVLATINGGKALSIRNDGPVMHGYPAVSIEGAEGTGLYIESADSFPALWIAGTPGGTAYSSDAVRITNGARGANTRGVRIVADSGDGLVISTAKATKSGVIVNGGASGYDIDANIHGAIDTARMVSSSGFTDTSAIKTLALNNPSAFYGPSSSGSGAYAFTVVTYDSANHQTLPGVSVAIRNLAQTALFAASRTDPQGEVSFNLNPAAYLAIADAVGYLFHPFDTITVATAGRDTLFAQRFNPGTPSSAALCRLYGHLFTLSGSPEPNAIVSASLPGGVARSGSLVISPFSVSTTTDSLGYFFLDLIPSDSLIPSGAKYEITINRSDGSILRQRLQIPSALSWRLDW